MHNSGLRLNGRNLKRFLIGKCRRRQSAEDIAPERRRRLPRGRISSSGQDLVEFAILVPILFLFVFGIVDLARVFHSMIVVGNAAREGSRYGIIYGLTLDLSCAKPPCEYLVFEDTNPANGVIDIIDATRAEALKLGVDLSTAAITVTCSPGFSTNQQCQASGYTSGLNQYNHDKLVVQVSYPFTFLTAIVFPKSTWNVIRTAEMRVP